MKKIIIVGGVAGGATAAARLRRLDEKAEIIMFELGEYISFANCGLPYYIGGTIKEKSALTLQTPASFNARYNVDVRVLSEVIAINKEKKTVSVKNHRTNEVYEESYDNLILSMGAEPIKPPIKGVELDRVFTLRNIPDTFKIKDFIATSNAKSAVVVGGGYIGVEMAENLVEAGLQVTMVEMLPQVIAPLDFDMACDVHRHIESKGVNLMLETALMEIVENDDKLCVKTSGGDITTHMVIMSIGVKPQTKIAREGGLTLNERGAIIVNDNMKTSDESIYAVGDCIEITDFVTHQKGLIPLAGPANKQGRIAADNICGIKSIYTGTQGSAILKVFDMTVATTGINEKTAKRVGVNYDKVHTYSSNHAGYYPGAINMSIKTVFEKGTGKILGAQIVGFDGCDKRCDVFATAIRFGATYSDLEKLELCYAPPYSSAKDPVNVAGFVIGNLISGRVKNFHWDEVEKLPRDGSVILLDTRTNGEYERGHIEGFINIPIDDLRGRISELQGDKPIYVTCQVGLRGYVACQIIRASGLECYNLSGGYRIYNAIFGDKKAEKTIGRSCHTKG